MTWGRKTEGKNPEATGGKIMERANPHFPFSNSPANGLVVAAHLPASIFLPASPAFRPPALRYHAFATNDLAR
jgi:hypothetical protein